MALRASLRSALLGSGLALCAVAANAQAHPFTVLHNFAGAPGDGAIPLNDVSFGLDGNLYGAVNLGGTDDDGVIFRLAPDGTETILYSFVGGNQGYDPNAGVTIDPVTGDMYGTTTFGGTGACRGGCGVLYRFAAGGTYTVLHTFDVSADGRYPAGQLIRDRHNNIFGSTTSGGPGNGGSVFEYTAKGAFKVLYAFSGADGFSPQGRLLQDKSGNLYGATMQGGANAYGTIFKLTPKGALITLYSFTGGADGGYPSGGLDSDKAGNLYGATNLAGNGSTPFGTVFRLSTGGTLTPLYAFTGGADGGYPSGDILLSHGKLYGTAAGGGANDLGVVYDIDAASGGETVAHSFSGDDGESPQAGLISHHGMLYGMASGGGVDDDGVVFSLKAK
jgi:uncharacterized repeat protein (TIGR03803 family)